MILVIGQNLDENIVYNIGRSVAEHFGSKSIVLGFDAGKRALAMRILP